MKSGFYIFCFRFPVAVLVSLVFLFSAACTEDVILGAPNLERTLADGLNSDNSNLDDDESDFDDDEDFDDFESDDTGFSPLAQSANGFSAGSSCRNLQVSAPRGLACLHCTQPQARNQARQIVDTMLQSCLRNIATNYLVDGTFGFDESFLLEQVTALTSGGRKPFITFYLANGPAQRQFESTVIDSFGTRMAPERFRSAIQSDASLQNQYRQIANRIEPVIRYAVQQGAVVLVIPALEDNLTDAAFQRMADLTLEVLPVELPVAIGRNPCSGCYPGNQSGIPAGIFEEIHTDWPGFNLSAGIVTNDGKGYSSNAVPDSSADTTLDNLRAVRDAATRQNNIFILWSASRQGLQNIRGLHPNPAARDYASISTAERQELILFLQE